jgi:hypothetical protein
MDTSGSNCRRQSDSAIDVRAVAEIQPTSSLFSQLTPEWSPTLPYAESSPSERNFRFAGHPLTMLAKLDWRVCNAQLHEELIRRLRFDGTRRDLKLEGLRRKSGVTFEVRKGGCRNGPNARLLVL